MTKKEKVIVAFVVVAAAAFYFGFLRFRKPSLKQVEQAIPVQVDSKKEQDLAQMKDKTQRAIEAAKKELQKPDSPKQ